jgi:hypothetical protein
VGRLQIRETGKNGKPNSECRHAESDQRELPPPRFVSRPPLLMAGNNTRHKHPLGKAGDVTRFWLGRSAARRLLSSRNHLKSRGSAIRTGATSLPLLARDALKGKRSDFSQTSEEAIHLLGEKGGQAQSFNIWSLKVAWASSRICLSVTSHCSQRANRIIVSRMGPLRSRNASA